MRIAYVTIYDPADVNQWSGLGMFIQRAITRPGCEVEVIGPMPSYTSVRRHWLRGLGVLYNRVLQRRLGAFSAERDIGIAQSYAAFVTERLREKRYDAVVCPGTIPIAYVRGSIPIAIWADATFHSLVTTYPGYKNMYPGYYRDGESIDRAAYSRAGLCGFASDWAAQSVKDHYGIAERKVKVVPFGANVDDQITEDVEAAIARRARDAVKLLFVGADFERKGGPKVLEVLRELRRLDVPATLDVYGCSPQVPADLRPHVQVHGFVSKDTAAGREKLAAAFLAAHWLLLLSEAEAYGLVLAEANRHGVPCISHRVGGIPTIVRDDRNGMLFSVDSPPAEMARYVSALAVDQPRYLRMASSAFEEFKTRLNWQVAGETFTQSLRSLVESPRSSSGSSTAAFQGRPGESTLR